MTVCQIIGHYICIDTVLILQFLMFPFQNDLRFGVEQEVDVVFASFIRKARDVEDIKKELGDKGRHIWIMSKVNYKGQLLNFGPPLLKKWWGEWKF